MNAQIALGMWRVETRKLLSRGVGRAGLVAMVLVALAMPMLLHQMANSGHLFNGVEPTYTNTAAEGLQWTLWLRNFWILRMFIVALAAMSFAGELQSKTLREDLIQPVPRWSVLVAKWAALVTWIGIGLGLSWLVAGALGVILFGVEGDWQMVVLAWLTSWLCDSAIAALALCAATFLRTVVMSLLSCLFFLAADWFLGIGLSIASWAAEMAEIPTLLQATLQIRPWLPSSAFGVWTSFSGGEPWLWQHFAALAAITFGSLALGTLRFNRTDVH